MRVVLVGVALMALAAAAPEVGPVSQTAAQAPAIAPPPVLQHAPAAPALSDAQMVHFLREAKVVRTKGVAKGVTGTTQATLSDGTLTHDASIQSVDEKKAQFDAPGSTEFNFEDSWRFNVAAYRLDRLIGLNMVPPSVERAWRSRPAAFTWWIDDVLMDEGARLKKKMQPPNSAAWNEQTALVRVFDQLIYNMDRNMGNMLIGNTWRVWAIDHTRAFRSHTALKPPVNVTRCDRQLLEGLRKLDREALKREIGRYVTDYQIAGILARRDKIVAILDNAGPAALFDRRTY